MLLRLLNFRGRANPAPTSNDNAPFMHRICV